jgi:hypothetical protein
MTATPPIVDRGTWQKQIDTQRVREKAHTREGTRSSPPAGGCRWSRSTRRRPMVGAAGEVPLIDTFEGRSRLLASYHTWYTGLLAADQRESCTFNTGHVLELSYLNSRDVTFAVFCQGQRVRRYRDFVGWEMPLYVGPAEWRVQFRDDGLLPARRRPRVQDVRTTGRGARPWETATGCSTRRSAAAKSSGRTLPRAGRSCTAATDSNSARFAMKIDKDDFLAAQPRTGPASPPAAPTTSAPPPSPPTHPLLPLGRAVSSRFATWGSSISAASRHDSRDSTTIDR